MKRLEFRNKSFICTGQRLVTDSVDVVLIKNTRIQIPESSINEQLLAQIVGLVGTYVHYKVFGGRVLLAIRQWRR